MQVLPRQNKELAASLTKKKDWQKKVVLLHHKLRTPKPQAIVDSLSNDSF